MHGSYNSTIKAVIPWKQTENKARGYKKKKNNG